MSRETKQLVALGTLTVVLVLCYVGMHWYINQHREQLALLRADLDNSALQEDALRGMQNLVRETEEERGELNKYLVTRDNPASFLEQLESVGAEVGVGVSIASLEELVSTGSNPESDPYGGVGSPQIRVSLEVLGTWKGVYAYLQLLEVMPYALAIEQVSIAQQETGSLWEGVVTIVAYTR